MTAIDPTSARTSAEVRAEIQANAEARHAAEAELARLGAARPALLLDLGPKADANLAAHDAAMAKASRTIERAGAVAGKLANDLVAAERAEDQAERRVQYEAAVAAGREAEAYARKHYPAAAAAIVAVLERLGQARGIVEAANRRLPDGTERVADPEDFRGRAAVPAVVIGQEMRPEYVGPDGEVVDKTLVFPMGSQPDPKSPTGFSSSGYGMYADVRRGIDVTQEKVPVTVRQVPENVYSRGIEGQPAMPLGRAVRLPGFLDGDEPLWRKG